MKSKLLWRLFAAFFIVIAISFAALYAILIPNLNRFFTQYIDKQLTDKAYVVREQMAQIPQAEWEVPNIDNVADKLSAELGGRVTIIDATGRVLGDSSIRLDDISSMDNHLNRPEVQAALKNTVGRSIRYSTTVNTNMMYVAVAMDQGYVRIAVPLNMMQVAMITVKRSVLLAIFISLALGCVVGLIFSRKVSRSVRSLVDAARHISEGDFSRRVAPEGRDEIGELAVALNELGEDLGAQHESLVQEKNQLLTVLDGMDEGVLVTDQNGVITLFNPALNKMFGLDRSGLGLSVLEGIRNKPLHDLVDRVLKNGKAAAQEIKILVNTHEQSLSIHTAPLRSSDGISGSVSVFYDLTEYRRLENMRKEFVANVSHELKTPLTSIRGYAETLESSQGMTSDKQSRFLNKIVKNATQLQNLIEDLLNLSEIESGRREMELSSVSLADVVADVLADCADAMKDKHINYDVDIPAEWKVKAETAALKQVLTNLIDNARKYTSEGGNIKIWAVRKNLYCEVSVEDSGMGIPESDLAHIFERFYRVDKARSREMGGTGLGLAIVKHLIQAQGGEVGVESQVNKGSRFFFTLHIDSQSRPVT